MRFLITIIASLVLAGSLFAQAAKKEFFVFFETPLVCGAKETIGCGLRAKPLLLDFEASEFVSEAWLNREGTIVAVVLKEPYLPIRQLLQKSKAVFDKHEIDWKPIQGGKRYQELAADLRKQGMWYRGAAVDSLSWEEAAWIAEDMLGYLEDFDKLRPDSATMLRNDVTQYLGTLLTTDSETPTETMHIEIIRIAARYVSAQAIERSIQRYIAAHQEEHVETYTSTFTCPNCGHRKMETLPADRCIMEYTCENCHATIKHKEGDCCVFCSYGDVKCPTAE